MTILLMNSALVDYKGHFEGHARAILTALRNGNHDVICLSSEDVDVNLANDLGVFGFFRTRSNCIYSNDEICWWIDDYIYQSKAFEDDLSRLSRINADDVIIYDCAKPAQISGFANWLSRCFDSKSAPKIIVILGWPSGTIVSNRDNLGNANKWELIELNSILYRSSINQINERYRSNFRFVTPSTSAAAAYSSLMNVRVETMPNPQFFSKPPRSRVGTEFPTIGFIGEQRENKGYRLVPEIINNLFKIGCCSKVIVQNSWGFMDDINRCLIEMSNSNDNLDVFIKTYDRAEWECLLDSIDLIVLPYNSSTYSTSSSGIGAEAIANSIPQIVPKYTGLSEMLDAYGCPGLKFESSTVENVTEAILHALKVYDNIATKANIASKEWVKINNLFSLNEFLMAGALR